MKSPLPLICSLASVTMALMLPLSAMAQTPLIFERAQIQINPAPTPPPAPNTPPTEPLPERTSASFDIELRPEEALSLEYIHALNTLTPTSGVMIALTTPAITPLPAMRVFTPVDALFIGDDGSIVQILPNVVLGEMTQAIEARVPIKAFLFLKAGQVSARAIRPRDRVSGAMFTPPPPIQE